MPHFKPMDPAFPIQQQIAIDAAVVLVNVFTLAAADEADFRRVEGRRRIHEAAARIHFDPVASRTRRQSDLPELRDLGID